VSSARWLGEPALPLQNVEARDALARAEDTLNGVCSVGACVLAATALYRPCVPNAPGAALAMRELLVLSDLRALMTSLQCAVLACRDARPKLEPYLASKLDRCVFVQVLAHILESMLAGKPNLFVDRFGEQLMQALGQLAMALEGVGQAHGEADARPLRRLLELSECELSCFVDEFADLRAAHPEATIGIAEAVLGKRQPALSKAELKDVVERCKAAAEGSVRASALRADGVAGADGWVPEELSALGGESFGMAARRLGGGGKNLWGKVTKNLKPIVLSRPRQMSGSI
jgi:hypothetical protein